MYDNNGALLDATGVQTAYVLDSLYAGKASTRAYGATFGGDGPAYRLWAPTAQTVALLTWPAGPRRTPPLRRPPARGWSAPATARGRPGPRGEGTRATSTR